MKVLVLVLVAVTITAAYASSFLKNEEYTTIEGRVILNFFNLMCIIHWLVYDTLCFSVSHQLREEAMYG